MIPTREWTKFEIAGLEGFSTDANFEAIEDWTLTKNPYLYFGRIHEPVNYWWYNGIVRPSDPSFKSQTSLDEILDAVIEATIGTEESAYDWTSIYLMTPTITDPNAWIENIVNGKYYDGENEWDSYPAPPKTLDYHDAPYVAAGDFPYSLSNWLWSYKTGEGCWGNLQQENLFRSGFAFWAHLWPPGGNPRALFSGRPMRLKIRYLNAIVNSLNRASVPLAGGVELVLTGLGFHNDEDELNEHAHPAIGWNDSVDKIYFEGLQGQVNPPALTLAAGDYTIDSNTQITIPAGKMPALTAGTYNIKLMKDVVAGGGIPDVYSYAGDFHCDSSGRIRDGRRIELLAADAYADEEKITPLILTKWRFKNKLGVEIIQNWSEIDICTPGTFYDGKITNLSSLRRGISDNDGLFAISDMTVEVANGNREISILLTTNLLKNQLVDIEFIWGNRPYAARQSILQCIVDDHGMKGSTFWALLKDITRKYFQVQVPRYLCTEAEFSDIHENAKGKAMPEVLGLCSVTTGDDLGATEARCVDTVNKSYLVARGSLYSITEVYSDNVLMAGGGVDYDIFYRDGGRTYIDFVLTQGDKKVTFNSAGYMFPDWDSAGGYVQNPAYIIAFAMAFLAEIPIELIDMDLIDALAVDFETAGYDTSGHLNLQAQTTFDIVLLELLSSYGCKGFPGNDGRLKIEKKSIAGVLSTSKHLFDQIDLIRPADRIENLRSAVNLASAIFNYQPVPDKYFGSYSSSRPTSIADFEAEIDGGSVLQFPWTNSENLVRELLRDILYRLGYGDKILSFPISMEHIDDYDLFTNFKYQDPFGPSADGTGEVGRYYYVMSLTYDWRSRTIMVEAIDLQWLLRQYFILGDEDALPVNWNITPDAQRIWGYLCNEITGKFADGEDGKILITEVGL